MRLEGTAPGPEILVQKPGVNNGKPIRDESLRINRTVGNGIANVFIYLTKPPAGTGAEESRRGPSSSKAMPWPFRRVRASPAWDRN